MRWENVSLMAVMGVIMIALVVFIHMPTWFLLGQALGISRLRYIPKDIDGR